MHVEELTSNALEVDGTEGESMPEKLSIDIFPESSLLFDSGVCLRDGCLLLPTPKDPARLLFLQSAPSTLSCRSNNKTLLVLILTMKDGDQCDRNISNTLPRVFVFFHDLRRQEWNQNLAVETFC